MKLFVAMARYSKGNNYNVYRHFHAEDHKEAQEIAKKRFPEHWNGWLLNEVTVVLGKHCKPNILKNAMKQSLNEPLQNFRNPKITFDPLSKVSSRTQKVRHVTGNADLTKRR